MTQPAVRLLADSKYQMLELPDGESAADVFYFPAAYNEGVVVANTAPKTYEMVRELSGEKARRADLNGMGKSVRLADFLVSASISD